MLHGGLLADLADAIHSDNGSEEVGVHGAGFANSSSLNAASIANFNFGKRKSWKVDGAVYAQPLYAPGMRRAQCAPYPPLSFSDAWSM